VPVKKSSTLRLAVVRLAFVAAIFGSYVHTHRSRSAPPADEAGGRGFRMVEVSESIGIRFRHELPEVDPKLSHILPQIAGTGASVSCVDYDDDGDVDLYTTTMRQGASNALYRNRGDGTFEDVAAEVGLADLNRYGEAVSHGSLWGDLDADGDQDVVLYGWGNQRLFLQEGGKFVDHSADGGVRRWMNCSAGTLFDYDRDGLLDVVLGGYYREDVNLWKVESTRVLHEDGEFARNGGRNVLLRNLGGGRFEDVTDAMGIAGDRWTYGFGAADFDGDGWIDLYVANDYGTEELFLNEEGERFELQSGLGLDEKSKSGMCVALGDITNKGSLSIYVTNISEDGWLFQGNNLRINRLAEGGKLPNLAEGGHGAQDCGWAWGAAFGDLDLDGDQDLVVVNGFRSANPDRMSYWYQMDKLGGATGRLIEDAANWTPFEDMSLSGFQRSKVLLTQAGGRMFDVAEEIGVDDLYDGRAVVLADIEADGDLDMIVANQDGPLLVYRNERTRPGAWIGWSLVGSESNRDAAGAEVLVEFGEAKQLHVVTAGIGFCSQADARVHVGLGESERPSAAEVRWPSGIRQKLAPEQLEPGRYHVVKEPTP